MEGEVVKGEVEQGGVVKPEEVEGEEVMLKEEGVGVRIRKVMWGRMKGKKRRQERVVFVFEDKVEAEGKVFVGKSRLCGKEEVNRRVRVRLEVRVKVREARVRTVGGVRETELVKSVREEGGIGLIEGVEEVFVEGFDRFGDGSDRDRVVKEEGAVGKEGQDERQARKIVMVDLFDEIGELEGIIGQSMSGS